MGLDMYLMRVKVKEEFQTLAEQKDWSAITEEVFKACNMQMEFEARYIPLPNTITWRKASGIHGWFVDNVQGGADDCEAYLVEESQLHELLAIVTKSLESKNPEQLPTRRGFFFGRTDYDDWYWDNLERTNEELSDMLKYPLQEDEVYLYQASW